VGTVRTPRYHGYLLAALTPPTGRVMLVPGLDVWIEGPWGRVDLTAQRYTPDIVHPNLADHLVGFARTPWPVWTYTVPGGGEVTMELFVVKGQPRTWLR